jgi:hypothetical protein
VKASYLSPVFVIGHIRIGTVEGASCVNLGNNAPTGFLSRKKHNQGFGSVGGDGNTVRDARSVLSDAAQSALFQDSEGEDDAPEWLRKLIADAGAGPSG